jgi:hypothetical protein
MGWLSAMHDSHFKEETDVDRIQNAALTSHPPTLEFSSSCFTSSGTAFLEPFDIFACRTNTILLLGFAAPLL